MSPEEALRRLRERGETYVATLINANGPEVFEAERAMIAAAYTLAKTGALLAAETQLERAGAEPGPLEEIRAVREEISTEHGHDIGRIGRHYMQRQRLAGWAIGDEFTMSEKRWRVTDVGSRTLSAIIISGPGITYLDESWFMGPPYPVPEHVIDEDDFPAIERLPKAERTEKP